MMPGWMMTGWGAGFGLFGGLMMLLFWMLIIAAVVLGVRWFVNEGKMKGLQKEETPLDILKKRYAKDGLLCKWYGLLAEYICKDKYPVHLKPLGPGIME